jgi:hypothetical protein
LWDPALNEICPAYSEICPALNEIRPAYSEIAPMVEIRSRQKYQYDAANRLVQVKNDSSITHQINKVPAGLGDHCISCSWTRLV